MALEHLRDVGVAGESTHHLRTHDTVRLRSMSGGQAGLGVIAWIDYELVRDPAMPFDRQWTARTRAYKFQLVDHGDRELLAYHWQPGTLFLGPDHPHLHVSSSVIAQVDALNQREIGLDKVHLATGQVSLAAFVRMVITQFEVAPLRTDWRETLDRAEADMLG